MNNLKQKRNRGVVLTLEGLKELQEARRTLESENNFGDKYTLEELCGYTGLDIHTIKKVLICKQKVDKRTIERFFTAFNLELNESHYTSNLLDKKQDWGEAICVSNFYGRLEELDKLEQWLVKDHCRLVTILGMAGVGKTSLSIKLATQLQEHFDCIIWRSLRNAPLIKDFLANLIQSLSGDEEVEISLPKSLNSRISLLINYLRKQRCLLVIDNVDTLLNSKGLSGQYCQEYDGYGEFFKRIGESFHQSCLLLTTREKPKEVAFMEGELLPVRTMQLNGFKQGEGQEILKIKGLSGAEEQLKVLVEHYGGNATALKMAATTIKDLFKGNIYDFLSQQTVIFGEIRNLLDQQFDRLTYVEQEIMYWLAINYESVSLSQLQQDMVLRIPKLDLLEALESLKWRSLIEQNATAFYLQPFVRKYIIFRSSKVFHSKF